MALGDVSIGDFMPHNTMMPEIRGFGDFSSGTVDTGFHRFTDVSADSGMTDVNTTAMSPYNPFFGERRTDRPAYDSATDPFRAQMKQAARVGNGTAYTQALDAIRQVDDVYGLVHGEMGVNDRETMDAFRYGQRKVDGQTFVGVADALAKKQAVYIANQAIRRGKHVRDLVYEEDELDSAFDAAYDNAFTNASRSGRIPAARQTGMVSYPNDVAGKAMRRMRAKEALAEIEQADGALYTSAIRGDALSKYCDYFAMSKAYDAFGKLSDTKIMREALKSAVATAEGNGYRDRSIFAKFNEECHRFGNDYFSFSADRSVDDSEGIGATDGKTGAEKIPGLALILRQEFEAQAAADLMDNKAVCADKGALSNRLYARLKDEYGRLAGPWIRPEEADAVWHRMADNIADQHINGHHVDLSKLATLYVQGGDKPLLTEKFDYFSADLYAELSNLGQSIITDRVEGRPAYYGNMNPRALVRRAAGLDKTREQEKDMFMGEGMRALVSKTVDDRLASVFSAKFIADNKEVIDAFKAQIGDLARGVNDYDSPFFVKEGKDSGARRTAQALVSALAISANAKRLGIPIDPNAFKGDEGPSKEGEPAKFRGHYTGTEEAFSFRVFAGIEKNLNDFITAHPLSQDTDRRTEVAVLAAKSYVDAITRMADVTNTDSGSETSRKNAQDFITSRLGFDPFTPQESGATTGTIKPARFNPYDLSTVLETEHARQAAANGQRSLVTNPDDFSKQRLVEQFWKNSVYSKINPVDSDRANSIMEVILANNVGEEMRRDPALMDAARKHLFRSIVQCMQDDGHIVYKGVTDRDEDARIVEIPDPKDPKKTIRARKSFVPNVSFWTDDQAIEHLNVKLRPAIGVIRGWSKIAADHKTDAVTRKSEATAAVGLRAAAAKENEMTSLPPMAGDRSQR